MAINRRETRFGPRFDVEWRLPDRSKRRKSFKTEREARVFEAANVTKTASGDVVDPRAGRVPLATVYQSWLASRVDLSPKVRRGYQDIWRLRVGPRFGGWSVGKIDPPVDPEVGQRDGRIGIEPTDTAMEPLCPEDVPRPCRGRGSTPGPKSRRPREVSAPRPAAHTYLTTAEVAALTLVCGGQGDVVSLLAYTGMRFGELTGLNVEDVDLRARRIRVRRSITQVGGRLVEGNPKSAAGRRSIPIPERLIPILTTRLARRRPGDPAITSPLGSRLGLENWKRSAPTSSCISRGDFNPPAPRAI
jgi:hypothetical protein